MGDIDIRWTGDKCASDDAALILSARWSFAGMTDLGRHRCSGIRIRCLIVSLKRSSLYSPSQSLSRQPIALRHGLLESRTKTLKPRERYHPAVCRLSYSIMTSIGTGYDLSNSVFSPDGRNFQVEYAVKAVENGGTAVGIRCKDGVVLALEKLVSSKLLKKDANKRIATVDRHVGVVHSGLLPDGRHFVSRARDEASSWRSTYKAPIPVASLANRMGAYVQAYTLYSSVRPFGITAIVGGWDAETDLDVDGVVGSGPSVGSGGRTKGAKEGGPYLYMIEPSGLYWGYYGAATGKGRQSAKAELEKLKLNPREADCLTLEQNYWVMYRFIPVCYLTEDTS
nr:putative proteasome subunit alpha type-7 [Quercus suber]